MQEMLLIIEKPGTLCQTAIQERNKKSRFRLGRNYLDKG